MAASSLDLEPSLVPTTLGRSASGTLINPVLGRKWREGSRQEDEKACLSLCLSFPCVPHLLTLLYSQSPSLQDNLSLSLWPLVSPLFHPQSFFPPGHSQRELRKQLCFSSLGQSPLPLSEMTLSHLSCLLNLQYPLTTPHFHTLLKTKTEQKKMISSPSSTSPNSSASVLGFSS